VVVSIPVFALTGIRLGGPPLPARAPRTEAAGAAAELRTVRKPQPVGGRPVPDPPRPDLLPEVVLE
jgi:hypothetical protein